MESHSKAESQNLKAHTLTCLLQLKITYSRHKDLNVKGNNERGMDYTGGAGGAPPSLAATGQPYASSHGANIPASSYQGAGAELLMGGGGGPVAQHEVPPSGES